MKSLPAVVRRSRARAVENGCGHGLLTDPGGSMIFGGAWRAPGWRLGFELAIDNLNSPSRSRGLNVNLWIWTGPFVLHGGLNQQEPVVSEEDLSKPMILPWWLWLWNKLRSESRLCPQCSPDFVTSVLAHRQRYIGHCPVCGRFWT